MVFFPIGAFSHLSFILNTSLFSLPDFNSATRRAILSSILISQVNVNVEKLEGFDNVALALETETVTPPTVHGSAETGTNISSNTGKSSNPWMIQLPLERYSGGTNCIRVNLSYKSAKPKPLFGIGKSIGPAYIPKKIFKVIVDTGSPYLVIANDMEYASYLEQEEEENDGAIAGGNRSGYGWDIATALQNILFQSEPTVPFQLRESGYDPTEEIYGSQKGSIEWKRGYVNFRDERLSSDIVLGVLDDALTQESGGPLLGLVKRSNYASEKVQLRPTFLEQLGGSATGTEIACTSFQIDSPNGLLTLAGGGTGTSLISSATTSSTGARDKVIPLVDLRQQGDFVEHYACHVEALTLDGNVYTPESINAYINGNGSDNSILKPIVAVFDTGLTGCLLTQPLWDILTKIENQNQNKTQQSSTSSKDLKDVKSIDVGVRVVQNAGNVRENKGDKSHTKLGTSTHNTNRFHFRTESRMPYFNLSPISLDWFDDEETCPHVVVLGQTFLSQGSLTIDIDHREAFFEIGEKYKYVYEK